MYNAATNHASPLDPGDRRHDHCAACGYGVRVTGRPHPRHEEIDLSEHAV
jgi:hypothetical protein